MSRLLTMKMTPSESPGELQRLERQALEEGRDWTRRLLQQRLQEEVDRMGPVSPYSGLKLKRAQRRGMTIRTVCGPVEIQVWYGYCRHSAQWVCPARYRWNLSAYQQLSPELEQRLCHTASETGSYEKAAQMAGVWGCAISDGTIHACIARKGQEALDHPLTDPLVLPAAPFSLAIMMDGWMARHRDAQWGLRPPDKSADRVRWHEIKSAVIFRLEDRGQTESGRRFLARKQVLATPANTDPLDFGQQVQREAMRMGLAKAHKVYVIQDGAVYLWNIFHDRFKQVAQGVLDFYHASDHLWALASELFGEGSDQAKQWTIKLLHQLRHGKETRVIRTLEELMSAPPLEHLHASEKINQTGEYFLAHKDHIHYADLANQGIPIGSGAMESQCSQFQNRFKRRGQFWTTPGFAALMAVSLRCQNQELPSLWAA